MGTFSTPPKFGTPKSGPAPQSIADWLQFFRWLLSLYRVTAQTSSVQQLTGFPSPSPPQRSFDLAALEAAQRIPGKTPADELTTVAQMALSRPPYPLRQVPTVIEDTHANRANYKAASYPDWWYFETDTLVLYLSVSGAWQYAAGSYSVVQASLAAYAATLGASDVGTLAWVSDYAHMLQWTGAAWQRGPGDPEHSDTFWGFGAAPSDTGWHVCDGTAGVHFLKYDGSLGSRDLPDLTVVGTGYMRLGPSYVASTTGPTDPTFTGTPGTTGATSAGTPAGTISTPTFSGNPLAPHSHKAPIGSDGAGHVWQLNVNGSGTASPGTDKWNSTGDTTSVSAQLTSSDTAGTPAGTISTPTFTGSPLATHTHSFTPVGTIALPDDPLRYFQAVAYYRQ